MAPNTYGMRKLARKRSTKLLGLGTLILAGLVFKLRRNKEKGVSG